MDIDEDRLNAITAFAERFAQEMGADLTFTKTTDLDETIEDARFVINTAMVGGHTFLERARKIGEKHGYYRGIDSQEFNMVSDYYTLTNWDQLSYFLTIARKMEKKVPRAWLSQAANPVFEGTTLIHRETGINMIGFCHGHFAIEDIAEAIGLKMEEVDWQVAGVNHGIWLNRFKEKKSGKDLYPALEEYFNTGTSWAPTNPFDDQLSPVAYDMYQFYGSLPIGDTPRNASWKYHYNIETKKKWYGGPWGGVDSEIGWKWYQDKLGIITNTIQEVMKEVASSPKANTKEALFKALDKYPEDLLSNLKELYNPETMSGEQHIPFIDAIENGNAGRFVVNTPNNGVVPGIDDDVATEFTAIVDKDGIHPENIDPQLPERVIKWYLRPRINRMEWALEAFLKQDPALITEFLVRDRRTQSLEQADAVVKELFKDR